MPESEDLLKAAQESLDAARLLASRGFHPDAVSRAYYAIVYAARAALASRGVAAKTHGGTLQRFGELFVAPGLLPSDLTTSFGKAMAIRNRADYSTAVRPGKEDSEAVLKDAERFVEAVRGLLSGN